jgi:pimeloyl-ACP methyl ester carboxylesterase
MQLTYHKADLDVWDAYDAIEAKTLLTRGERSDVLAGRVAEEMTRRGPKPELHVVAGCGHAPTLAGEGEIALLRAFLAG